MIKRQTFKWQACLMHIDEHAHTHTVNIDWGGGKAACILFIDVLAKNTHIQ